MLSLCIIEADHNILQMHLDRAHQLSWHVVLVSTWKMFAWMFKTFVLFSNATAQERWDREHLPPSLSDSSVESRKRQGIIGFLSNSIMKFMKHVKYEKQIKK